LILVYSVKKLLRLENVKIKKKFDTF